MIRMYCRHRHHYVGYLCEDCLRLAEYTERQVQKCRFGFEKPVCVKCPVHCYKTEMRKKIREVMRFSGPRMITRHPYFAIMHLIDKKRFNQRELKVYERIN